MGDRFCGARPTPLRTAHPGLGQPKGSSFLRRQRGGVVHSAHRPDDEIDEFENSNPELNGRLRLHKNSDTPVALRIRVAFGSTPARSAGRIRPGSCADLLRVWTGGPPQFLGERIECPRFARSFDSGLLGRGLDQEGARSSLGARLDSRGKSQDLAVRGAAIGGRVGLTGRGSTSRCEVR